MHPPPAKIPTLTILSHPQVSRVGERAKLWPAGEAEGEALLSRWQLDFAPPGGGEARPLDDPYLSRRPLHFTAARFGGIRLDCSRSGTRLVANEDWVSEDRVFLGVEVERGVVLVLAERLVLLLHNLAPDLDEKTPTFGLFGEASAMLRLRQEIGRRREDSRPLLVLGPTGAGKTSVARAIHAARSEESRPRLEIDAGETTPFESLPDLWEQARGGSLILSRPEMIPEELQTEILRHHEAEAENVQLIGVAAAELSRDFEERRSGPLVEALLANAVEVPELVHRRDDIGRLLFHFLSDELANLDALHRLDDPGPYAPAWCPVRLVGRLASYEWPENVRQLERVSQSLAKLYHGKAEIDLDLSTELEALLEGREEPATDDWGLVPGAEEPSVTREPSEISENELLAALRMHRWQAEPTAAHLGIAPEALFAMMDKYSERTQKRKRKSSRSEPGTA